MAYMLLKSILDTNWQGEVNPAKIFYYEQNKTHTLHTRQTVSKVSSRL